MGPSARPWVSLEEGRAPTVHTNRCPILSILCDCPGDGIVGSSAVRATSVQSTFVDRACDPRPPALNPSPYEVMGSNGCSWGNLCSRARVFDI